MTEEVIQLAASQGIWALLSIILIFYILRAQENRDEKQDAREAEYQKIILALTDRLEVTNQILDQLSDIKHRMNTVIK